VHNLAQAANWRYLVKTSLELQSCPLFQINRRPKSPRSVTFGHGQVYLSESGDTIAAPKTF
jgi:hypothetical protein